MNEMADTRLYKFECIRQRLLHRQRSPILTGTKDEFYRALDTVHQRRHAQEHFPSSGHLHRLRYS